MQPPTESTSYNKKPPKPRSVYITTYGCQMNVRDSQIILGVLRKQGYEQADCLEKADIILFNTCSVRQHAEERVWGKAGMLERLKTQNLKSKVIGIIGCMAQNYQDEIFRRLPHINLVCGPSNIYDIPDLLKKIISENTQVMAVNRRKRPLLTDCQPDGEALKAYVSIMYGCNNYCSYCIVPYVRGRESSRPLRHILNEVKNLASHNFKEITLLGQNVNSYGKDLNGKIDFIRLLENLDKIAGIERIRFITSHPKDVSKELFRAMKELPKVCEHLHLPLQSGSDKILRLMNRKYTLRDYLKLIDDLRRLIPECSLTTDIIVGFPGESEADFQRTYQAMERIQFDEAFIFKYSPRPKTKAAELEDDVPLEIKRYRNQKLLALQERISLKKNKALLGRSLEILAEGVGSYFAGRFRKDALKGRTRTNKVTLFSGKRELISQMVDVKITRALTHTLIGEINGKKT